MMKRYNLTTNLGLKVIAFIFAALLWLIVVNLDNPVVSKTFREIPVTIVNDDIITSAGDVYQVVGEQSVSVVVYATRDISQELEAEDIVATADVTEMDTATGLIPIEISIPDYSGDYESAEAVPRNLTIQREKSGKKVLSLSVKAENDPADGYILGNMTVEPEQVTLTGAESVLAQIARAEARVNVEGMTADQKAKAELRLYDADGNVLNPPQIENDLGEEGITVSVEVLKLKSVPIVLDVTGTPAEGYKYTGGTSTPENLQVCGKSADLEGFDEIEISGSVLDVSGASDTIEKNIDISEYLPEGVRLAEQDSGTVKVTLKVEQEGTRSIDFLVSSLRINNLSEKLQVNYETGAEIVIRVSGDEARLNTLDITNAVYVDLGGYTTPGTYDIPVKVDLPDGVTLEEQVTVSLTLEEKTGQEVPDDETDQGEESD